MAEIGRLAAVLRAIPPLDDAAARAARVRLDRLTKPLGSLGRLEDLACRYAAMTGGFRPAPLKKALYTFAADHGVAAEGVSAYPQAVTAQMVHNFLRGGAGVNVLARHVGVEVRVVDIGVDHDFPTLPGLLLRKVMRGTRNLAQGPAMTSQEAMAAIEVGLDLARAAADEGVQLLGGGDMGIANTTSSSAITAVLTGASPRLVTGRGTGIDEATHAHKIQVIEQAIARNRPDPADPLDVLAKVGGLEIAGITGLILGAAARRLPVVVDGFISSAAALIATRLAARAGDYCIAAHLSVETGHRVQLEAMHLAPLLDLDLRLGEGTGACLGMGLVEAAVRIATEMATFGEAGVSERQS